MVWLVFFIIAFLLGVAVYHSFGIARLQAQVDERHQIERDILRAAMQCGGRITAIDVRTRLACSIEDVERHLRMLHAAGYCESELSRDGNHLYIFKAFDDAPMRAQVLEKYILQIAHRHDGVVLVAQVAMETDLNYVQSRELLYEMADDKMCERISDDAFRFFPSRKHVSGALSAPLNNGEQTRDATRLPLAAIPDQISEDGYEVDESTGIIRVRDSGRLNE